MDKDTRQFLRAMEHLTSVLKDVNGELHQIKKLYSLDVMLKHDLKDLALELDKEEKEREG